MIGLILSCYVFGDSLTSPAYSWANQLNHAGHNLQVNAVPARRLVDLVVSPDYKKTAEIDCAILHLGSNDATGSNRVDYVQHYTEIIALFEGNGLQVYCVLPPRNDVWSVDWTRDATRAACANVIDVPTGMYIDGVHPSAFGHLLHGYQIYAEVQKLQHQK